MAVTLSPLAGAGWQFFDNDGIPLSGGLLYSYAAGTSTPLATYTSFSGSIQNSNPIVLDSAGRVPNEVWITYGYGYKFILQNSSFVQIGTWDNIPTNAPPPLLNDASSIAYEQGYTVTAGSFVVGKTYLITSVGTTNFVAIGAANNTVGTYFVATGVGSGTGTAELSRTVQNKLQEIFSVKDFGAVGDGSTDDTAAIQAAIVAANTFQQSGNSGIYGPGGFYVGTEPTVYFPHGVYKVSSALTPDTVQFTNYIRFIGENSIIVPSANTTASTTASFSSGATSITVTSATNIAVGSVISGTGIPLGTTVLSVVGTTLNISLATTTSSSGTYVFTGFTIFGGIGYKVTFKSLTFRGGNVAISIKTSNADADYITIEDCEFHCQQFASIQTDNNSLSTIININRCMFMQTDAAITVGYSLFFLSGDFTVITNCWFQSYTPVPIYNAGAGMFVKSCIGVPGGTLTNWFTNYGNLNIESFRFGGENGGETFVDNYAGTNNNSTDAPTYLKIINCPWSQAIAPNYVIKFFALPNVIELNGIDGLLGGNAGLYFDNAIDAVQLLRFTQFGQVSITNNSQYGTLIQAGTNATAVGRLCIKTLNAMLYRDSYQLPVYKDRFKSTELYGSGGFNSGAWTVVTSNSSVAYTADDYGVSNAVITASANNGSASFNWAGGGGTFLTYANLVYKEAYTFSLCVYVNPVVADSGVVSISISIGGSIKLFSLGRGKHILTVPFVYLNYTGAPSTAYDADNCRIGIGMQTYGDVVNLGRATLTYGMAQYTKQNLTIEATASPAAMIAGTGNNVGYYQADQSFLFAPSASNPPGYVCITQGNPGTWRAMANLA